ncbi:MAG: class I SAM-dependent methyltransferase [Armatimonadota bacterium]
MNQKPLLVQSEDDLHRLLDELLNVHEDEWWSQFYSNRAKPCPFFVNHPDESLVEWVSKQMIPPGRALDIGCGNGRNSTYLAKSGFTVDGVDYAQEAINWANDRALSNSDQLTFHCQSIFDFPFQPETYDLVYDSGCFHHMPPHRRRSYVDLVSTALNPGGWFGLTCFTPCGGSGLTDQEVYEARSLKGGLGYTEEQLRDTWGRILNIVELRQMRKPLPESGLFGEEFLWVMIGQKSEG